MMKILDISGSALIAQRERMNVIAGNIANAHSTRDADGNLKPVDRRTVDFFPIKVDGKATGEVGFEVKVDKNVEPRRVHEPGHPYADKDGFVNYPGINVIDEFTDAVLAGRAYEANLSSIQMARQMAEQTLRLLQ